VQFADLLKNESAPLELRFAAAKELAPYVHPKLASIEARGGGQSHEDRLAKLQRLLPTAEEGTDEGVHLACGVGSRWRGP
jgi:hypothetical protein